MSEKPPPSTAAIAPAGSSTSDRGATAARLAVAAGRLGDLEEALRQWTAALEARPAAPSWWAQKGRIQMRAGLEAEAFASFAEADRLKPGVPAWGIALAELRRRRKVRSRRRGLELSAHYYDAVYKVKDAYRGAAADSIYLPVWTRIVCLLQQRNVASVLDLGCGPGQFAEFLLSRLEVTYVGYDFSAEAIALAKSRSLAATFKRANILRWAKPPDGHIDAVIATEFLEHIEDDIGVLRRLPRNVYLVASVPDFDSFGHVRFFRNADSVRERYAPLVADLSVETIRLSETSAIHIFSGRAIGS